MSRRSGQTGCEEKSGNWYVVRFWKDVEGQEGRKLMREKICPSNGPGKLSRSERLRKSKEIIAASGADTVEHFEKVVRSNHWVTFREQAITWLEHVKNRKRKPVAPSTLEVWESALKNWLNPNIGDMPLDTVNNLVLKQLVAKLVASGKLAPCSIRSYTQVVKMVVASAIDEQGEQLYARKWNAEFIDMPEVKGSQQKRPAFTGEVVTGIMARTKKPKYRLLFAVCASAGLRFGEALGIDLKNVSKDFTTVVVNQKVWRGRIQDFLKTESGEREVDLHPTVARALETFVGKRQSGLLFQTRSGGPLHQSNILRRTLHPILAELNQPKCGVHAFRRFRVTYLREQKVHEDLIKFWIGHAAEDITDIYSKLKQNVAFRKKMAEQVGIGFELPEENAPNVPMIPKSSEIPDAHLPASA